MSSYLIDTNILIHILAGDIPEEGHKRLTNICSEGFSVSIITRIELLGWKDHTPDLLEKGYNLLECARIISLSDPIADIAIEIRQEHSIKLPDAVIAATSLYMKDVLVTRNVKDFQGIEGILLLNPFALS